MNNYQDRVNNKLEAIAHTVDKLDSTLSTLHADNAPVKGYFEQEKALHEIKNILRQADDIDSIRRSQAKRDIDTLGAAESGQDEAVNEISNQVMRLDDTLDRMQDSADKNRSYVEQRIALHEIKHVLHQQGFYSSYRADELDALGSLGS